MLEFLKPSPAGKPRSRIINVMERLRTNDSLALIPVIVLTARDGKAREDRAFKGWCEGLYPKTCGCRAFGDLVSGRSD
jgi:CheY-like chemotaxis protein